MPHSSLHNKPAHMDEVQVLIQKADEASPHGHACRAVSKDNLGCVHRSPAREGGEGQGESDPEMLGFFGAAGVNTELRR